MTRTPIRWRLTAWYALFLVASFLVLGAALYIGLRVIMFDTFREDVTTDANLALAGIQLESGVLAIDPDTLAAMEGPEQTFLLYDVSGTRVAASSQSRPEAELTPGEFGQAVAGQSALQIKSFGDEKWGVATRPVRSGDTVIGVAVVALSREDVEQSLNFALLLLGLATPVVAAIGAVGGYVIAGRALAPVVAITNLAALSNATNLSARLELDLPNDELGRLASTFNQMLARIEEQIARQRRFTGDAAHELRTPISLMRSELDLALSKSRSEGEYRAALGEMDRDLERVTGLISTLLLLARADSERLELNREPFDLALTVRTLAEQFAPEAETAGIHLVTQVSETWVDGDEDLLIQVFVNLITNSLRHTSDGGRIELGCRTDLRAAIAWVEDTGAGIAKADLPRVFDRFFRADTGRTRAAGGTGLGLSISRELVHAHGGEVEISSEPGRGTRVEVTLPLSN